MENRMDQANKLRDMLNRTKPETAAARAARVIAVTSGKGGVGKTNFTVNLALYLQSQGVRVVVVDADFGLANIEILLGVAPQFTLADVISNNYTIDQVITEHESGLRFVSGGSGLSILANVDKANVGLIVDKLAELDAIADVILIDTGAGISESVLQFVIAADETIVICVPEPTSITDAYSLIKSTKERTIDIPKFKIVVNRAENKEEGLEIHKNLQRVSVKFLSINLEYLGVIPSDPNLVRAVKKQSPCLLTFPNSVFATEITNIGMKIMDISKSKESAGMKGFMRRLINIFNK